MNNNVLPLLDQLKALTPDEVKAMTGQPDSSSLREGLLYFYGRHFQPTWATPQDVITTLIRYNWEAADGMMRVRGSVSSTYIDFGVAVKACRNPQCQPLLLQHVSECQ